jgi:hypothetical protein
MVRERVAGARTRELRVHRRLTPVIAKRRAWSSPRIAFQIVGALTCLLTGAGCEGSGSVVPLRELIRRSCPASNGTESGGDRLGDGSLGQFERSDQFGLLDAVEHRGDGQTQRLLADLIGGDLRLHEKVLTSQRHLGERQVGVEA